MANIGSVALIPSFSNILTFEIKKPAQCSNTTATLQL